MKTLTCIAALGAALLERAVFGLNRGGIPESGTC